MRRQSYPYRPVRKENVTIWTHKFFCLACVGTRTLPMSKAAKEALVAMNLGEKVVSIESSASPSDLHVSILEAFPPLGECGGYTLLRCTGNTKILEVLEPPPGGHTPISIASVVGQSRVYVRPLQRDITAKSAQRGTEVCLLQ